MKRFKKHSYRYAAACLVLALIVTISFQNCGRAGFDAGETDSSSIDIGNVDAKLANAPLAFDAAFDTISYMGCFGNGTVNKAGFYTLRAGAYTNNGGLRVKNEFITYASDRNVIAPIYPNVVATTEQIKEFLSKTPMNVSSMPQMALRQIRDLRYVQTNASTATVGTDFINMTFDPTDDRIMDPMVRAPNSYFNYFPLAPSSTRTFEGKLTFNTNEILTRDFRYSLGGLHENRSRLSLTFATNNTSSTFRTPSSMVTRAYGRAYEFTFAVPPNHYLYFPENIVSNVTEYNLESGAATGVGFSCPASLRLKIIRPKDRARCPMDSIASLNNADYRNRLNIVRRHLKAEYWDVSINGLCAVPREQGADCYPSDTNPLFEVAYDQPAGCFSQASIYPPGMTLPTPWCPQYVSFCIK